MRSSITFISNVGIAGKNKNSLLASLDECQKGKAFISIAVVQDAWLLLITGYLQTMVLLPNLQATHTDWV